MKEYEHCELRKQLAKADQLFREIENLRSRIQNINESWSIGLTSQGVACYNFKPDTGCNIEVLDKQQMKEIHQLTVEKVVAPLHNKLQTLLKEYAEL